MLLPIISARTALHFTSQIALEQENTVLLHELALRRHSLMLGLVTLIVSTLLGN
jgi:hypothetical protein